MKYVKNKKSEKICYEVYNEDKYNLEKPYIVFLHGYGSSKNATKGNYLKNFTLKNNLPYLSLDLSSCGESEGNILNSNIEAWLYDIELVLQTVAKEKQKILVGSSLGGWLAMLYCLKHAHEVHSILALAPAPDFHKDILKEISKNELKNLKEKGYLELNSDPLYDSPLIMPLKLLENAEKFSLLDKKQIKITKPFTIIHGMQDNSVDYKKSITILQKLQSNYTKLILSKNSNHSLSSNEDLKEISNQIIELLNKRDYKEQ